MRMHFVNGAAAAVSLREYDTWVSIWAQKSRQIIAERRPKNCICQIQYGNLKNSNSNEMIYIKYERNIYSCFAAGRLGGEKLAEFSVQFNSIRRNEHWICARVRKNKRNFYRKKCQKVYGQKCAPVRHSHVMSVVAISTRRHSQTVKKLIRSQKLLRIFSVPEKHQL